MILEQLIRQTLCPLVESQTALAKAIEHLACAIERSQPDAPMLTARQAGVILGLHPKTVYRKQRELKAVKLGRKVVRFPRPAVIAYLKKEAA